MHGHGADCLFAVLRSLEPRSNLASMRYLPTLCQVRETLPFHVDSLSAVVDVIGYQIV